MPSYSFPTQHSTVESRVFFYALNQRFVNFLKLFKVSEFDIFDFRPPFTKVVDVRRALVSHELSDAVGCHIAIQHRNNLLQQSVGVSQVDHLPFA